LGEWEREDCGEEEREETDGLMVKEVWGEEEGLAKGMWWEVGLLLKGVWAERGEV